MCIYPQHSCELGCYDTFTESKRLTIIQLTSLPPLQRSRVRFQAEEKKHRRTQRSGLLKLELSLTALYVFDFLSCKIPHLQVQEIVLFLDFTPTRGRANVSPILVNNFLNMLTYHSYRPTKHAQNLQRLRTNLTICARTQTRRLTSLTERLRRRLLRRRAACPHGLEENRLCTGLVWW